MSEARTNGTRSLRRRRRTNLALWWSLSALVHGGVVALITPRASGRPRAPGVEEAFFVWTVDELSVSVSGEIAPSPLVGPPMPAAREAGPAPRPAVGPVSRPPPAPPAGALDATDDGDTDDDDSESAVAERAPAPPAPAPPAPSEPAAAAEAAPVAPAVQATPPAAAPRPAHIAASVAKALRVYDTFPRLPEPLRQQRVEYLVRVDVCVSDSGYVSDVVTSGATAPLDVPLRAAIRTWRYRPLLVDGEPTPFCHSMEIEYKVN